jgi:hypothetical protein
LLTLFGVIVRRFELLRRRWREIAVAAGTFLSLMLMLHFTDYRARVGGLDALITGRYLLPAVAVYAVTIAFVLRSLPARVGQTLAGVAIGANIVLMLACLGTALERLNA